MGRWQEVDHTADLALRVWGMDLADVFATAAQGMFSLLTDLDSIVPTRSVSLVLDSLDAEALLVDWLNELLYLNEVEGLALTDFVFEILTPTHLEARVQGGLVQEYWNYIKAATFHNLEIRPTMEGYVTELVFDT